MNKKKEWKEEYNKLLVESSTKEVCGMVKHNLKCAIMCLNEIDTRADLHWMQHEDMSYVKDCIDRILENFKYISKGYPTEEGALVDNFNDSNILDYKFQYDDRYDLNL